MLISSQFRLTNLFYVIIVLVFFYLFNSHLIIRDNNYSKVAINRFEKALTDEISLEKRPEPVLIFIHLPKTGGSLIRHILGAWCRSNNKFCISWNGDITDEIRKNFSSMSPLEQNKIDLIFAHVPFGFHTFLTLKRPVRYFTILRDPVKQAVSGFHYMRFRDHYLGGAFALQSAISQFNETLGSSDTSLKASLPPSHLNRKRNFLISLLIRKDPAFKNAKLCFAGYGGSDGWSRAHNYSLRQLQTMENYELVTFADEVVNKAWKSNCTARLSPLLTMSFSEFLEIDWNWKSSWKTETPSWDFGNNPATSIFCCYHFWFGSKATKPDKYLLENCAHVRNKRTLNCALDNMKKIDLILITEAMNFSIRLLEIFLNWKIPAIFKEARINQAVYVTPGPPSITPQDLILAEKKAKLDRIIYLTGLKTFWDSVHSSNISLTMS